MRRGLGGAVVVAVLALLPAPALAAGGAGLYAPFPDPAKQPRLRTYLDRAGIEASTSRLTAGVRLDAGTAPARPAGAAPSDRAGVTTSSTGWGVVLVALLVAAVAAASLPIRRGR